MRRLLVPVILLAAGAALGARLAWQSDSTRYLAGWAREEEMADVYALISAWPEMPIADGESLDRLLTGRPWAVNCRDGMEWVTFRSGTVNKGLTTLAHYRVKVVAGRPTLFVDATDAPGVMTAVPAGSKAEFRVSMFGKAGQSRTRLDLDDPAGGYRLHLVAR